MSGCVLAGTERTARARALRIALLFILTLRVCSRGASGGGGGGGGAAGGGMGAALVCARTPGLAERQRAMCRAAPAAMPVIQEGLRLAFAECRAAFAGRRWNCSGVGEENPFAHIMPVASREAAFTYAMASAGVAHALSAACARGDLPACGCNTRRRMSHEQWEWSGVAGAGGAGAGGPEGARCAEAAYGARLARRFLDARELERDARALMNLHNNRVGRKTVKELVRRECKCHGVSGSCTVRTCWRALPALRAVAAALRDKHRRAKQVAAGRRGAAGVGGGGGGRTHVQLYVKRGRRPRKAELVFLAPSPSYCEPAPALGALGTHHRLCNHTSTGEDGCGAVCCGRGWAARREAVRAQCRCRFHWCCRVHCDLCTTTRELHVCN